MRRVGTKKRLRVNQTVRAGQQSLVGLAQAVVASAYGVTLREMRTRTRKIQAQEARQLATYLARVVFEIGLRELARETGRSPGTTCHACRKVEQRRDRPEFDRAVDYLEMQLRAAAAGQ